MGKYIKSIHRMVCGGTPHRKTEEIKPPKYHCISCRNRIGNRCEFFKRPVVKDYNKCYYHTCYNPVSTVFKTPDNLEELIEAEEKKIA
jgi:hypothetical protein